MKKYIFLYIFVLPLIMLATGCASDDTPDNNAPSTVGFSISTRAAADPGTLGDPANDNEKINSYKIFIVDRNSRVRAIVEKTLTSAVEEDFFTADLPDGTYSFYALANITNDDINGKLEITGDETATNNIRSFFRLTQSDIAGKSVDALPVAPSLETIKSVVWRYMYVQNGFEGQIPMSGYRTDVKVTGKIEEAFSIEVVRMLAKIEFEFSSPNAEVPAHIKNVTLHATSEGPIPFMPDYSILGVKAPTLLDDVTAQDLSFNTNLTLSVGSNDVVSTGAKYLRESVATHPSGGYLVSVAMDRTDKDGSTSTEVIQYAIANELQYINRNDHIIIPIEVTDWIIEVDVRFYPPIGGYPAVITEDKNREYYITFGTEGWFEIETRVRYAAPGSQWLEKGKYEVALRDAITGDAIFEQAPAISATGEITGRLNTSKGRAQVPVSITVHQDGKPDMSYLKTITIIKN